jgi:hypothetical protein
MHVDDVAGNVCWALWRGTPLHAAARHGRTAAVEMLLMLGARADAPDAATGRAWQMIPVMSSSIVQTLFTCVDWHHTTWRALSARL